MDWLQLPDWLDRELGKTAPTLGSIQARMAYVIALARRNVHERTGGPFAAAVFERGSGRLVCAGVNRVVPARCSHAHAEMIAIALAQSHYGTHDLSAPGVPPMQLVSSCEPCAMCLGAVNWSGVAELVCGARDSDVREAGFDEGPKPDHWQAEFARRRITIQTDVMRADATSVLLDYVRQGGADYSPARTKGRPSPDDPDHHLPGP